MSKDVSGLDVSKDEINKINLTSNNYPGWTMTEEKKDAVETTGSIIEPVITKGLVLYCDGGARPNPGFGGWGMHGYLYSNEKPKKGSGNSSQYLIKDGYLDKSSVTDKTLVQEIKPISYINGYGSFTQHITNNIAELTSTANALEYANEKDIKDLTILTDSEQVVKGASDWLNVWKNNNWLKTDGNPVANKDNWLNLSNNLDKLISKGINVNFKWVQGHSTFLGNQLADKLATVGVLHSKDNKNINQIEETKADGYWSNTSDKNPLINLRSLYFSTRTESIIPGEYFLGNHGKDDELLGKRTADGCYGYVQLKTPEPVIELMRNKQCALACCLDVIIMARLDKLFEADIYKDMLNHGEVCLYAPSMNKLDLCYLDKEPVTKELRPPRLALRAVEAVNILKGITLAWQSDTDTTLTQTDVTDVFYETDEKGNLKLKSEFVVGFSTLPVEITYDKNKKDKVDIVLGVDLPERNYLKRLEKMNPKVYVVTWMESDKMYRYATIVKTDDDIGCYCGFYSNQHFVK